ncbi:uncharacterized protein EAE98_000411 [Botrytis deweyae]|uniref:Uncharacterized protein n=1 Tax=Botrytis deweyae TaxID=2478750 RepID=A0ABQ7J2L5_9HELO|nr:uncharacterized protein EAE98_000411 [Botrytis deweyae]KAF7940284.1 hypothetical protein EAE98_000411 [Botrytis deweyae]
MSSKKRAPGQVRRDNSDHSDYFDGLENGLKCSYSNRFRKPIILKPGIMEQEVKGNEVIQRWGLPTPCKCKARDNTADIIVSAIGFCKPSALVKLLDPNVSQFYWCTSTYNMDFCVRRSWKYLRVTLDKRALSYHIDDDGRWQLLGSERLGIEEICTLEDHYKENWHECHIAKSDRILAGRLGNSLPWHQELLKDFDFECYVTTKDGHWINIGESEAAGGNATVADKNSTPKQVSIQSGSNTEIETVTMNATGAKKADQTDLRETKKRKCAAE